MYSKDSLDTLRQQVDLAELVGSYIDLKPAGGSLKGLCPFHNEKTPSFVIQRGAAHYHCFGCGAHGDAIAFLMDYEKMTFTEAVESLSERFRVSLKHSTSDQYKKGPAKKDIKHALQLAVDCCHFYLLHTDEGHAALRYVYRRGLDLAFVRTFQIGLAPKNGAVLMALLRRQKIKREVLQAAGLVQAAQQGTERSFFIDRLMFPILNYAGQPIGFSARKFKESTFGPKYINTPETTLFRKSSTLYGLSFCRKRITKEKRAVIVEGQIDALRLIQEGLTITVAGQGTAFTNEHSEQLLQLGVKQVYLALDGDHAGREAAVKVGSLLQSKAVEVKVAALPDESDPDTFLAEFGIEAFLSLLEEAKDYVEFLVEYWSYGIDLCVPAQKNALVQKITSVIRSWKQPILEIESLRQLSRLLEIPGKLLQVEELEAEESPFVPHCISVQKAGEANPDWTLDIELLRWLFLEEARVVDLIVSHVEPKHFYAPICRELFSLYLTHWKKNNKVDFVAIVNELKGAEQGIILAEIIKKRVDRKRAEKGALETVNALLKRHWMWEREKINLKIASGRCSEEELTELTKAFNAIIRNPPEVQLGEEE